MFRRWRRLRRARRRHRLARDLASMLDCLSSTTEAPSRPRLVHDLAPVNWDTLSDELFQGFLRFERPGFALLLQHLGLPDVIDAGHDHRASSATCLRLLLCRLSYPCTLNKIGIYFAMSPSKAGRLIRQTLIEVNSRWGHLLSAENLLTISDTRLDMSET